MEGLNAKDIEILRFYAEAGNRELYFNYLAHKAGNDGYPLLALGVVRNDNAPGATANVFADNQARADGVAIGERGWHGFGVDLMRADFALRFKHFEAGRPDLALNLPVRDVQNSHDPIFRQYGINPDGWTPRQLLEAARRHGGEEEAEKVWAMLRDNSFKGVTRLAATTLAVSHHYNDDQLDANAYLEAMGKARNVALGAQSNTDPHRIALDGRHYRFDEKSGGWMQVQDAQRQLHFPSPVTSPETLETLNDLRQLRMDRQQLREQFHSDDPNQHRPIMASPWLVADAEPVQPQAGSHEAELQTAGLSHGMLHQPLYRQCVAGVERLDAMAGKPWDTHSQCMAGSLTLLAASEGLQRVDQVLLSVATDSAPAGSRVFVVQGDADNPAHHRAGMDTALAVQTPFAQSVQQLQVLEHQREQGLAAEMVAQVAQAEPAGRGMALA